MLNLIFLLIISLLSGDPSQVISGQLKTYEYNQPIEGATIVLGGTGQMVTTDYKGNFTLNALAQPKILQISFIGYCSTRIILPSEQSNIELGEIKLFRNFNRAIMVHGVIDRNLLKDKPVYLESEPKDSIQHLTYRTELIPNECFSYEGSTYKFEPTLEDEVTLDLNKPNSCKSE